MMSQKTPKNHAETHHQSAAIHRLEIGAKVCPTEERENHTTKEMGEKADPRGTPEKKTVLQGVCPKTFNQIRQIYFFKEKTHFIYLWRASRHSAEPLQTLPHHVG